ncbi:HAD family phosphatase [Skermanella rosea]|uniref:HAD family hydrolase n=1 Tax=Skermanella rosea TaxID=1817965 RepID=UPI0019349723|nr:HAD family phosphatase [Skermanella rosea]UEM05115.1 HAD family phosphatase [Skermanella rosea]
MPRSADPSIAVFDIGGVLIDWNPRYLYRKLFAEDTAAMEEFLATVCTPDWNLQQDAGRPWKEAVEELSARHPEKAELIAAYDLEWDEMVPGPIPDTADIVWDLKRRGQKVYCITNFSVDKLDRARRRFDVLNAFDGIVVSGEVRLLKPDPAIYRRLLDDHGLSAGDTLFIDDVEKNVEGARHVGMHAVRFTDAESLRRDLACYGML